MREESIEDWGPGLLEALGRIEEKPKGVRLVGVLALAVCAMRSLYAIWGREQPQLAQSLGFTRERTPCVATLSRISLRLDADAFEGPRPLA